VILTRSRCPCSSCIHSFYSVLAFRGLPRDKRRSRQYRIATSFAMSGGAAVLSGGGGKKFTQGLRVLSPVARDHFRAGRKPTDAARGDSRAVRRHSGASSDVSRAVRTITRAGRMFSHRPRKFPHSLSERNAGRPMPGQPALFSRERWLRSEKRVSVGDGR